MKAVILALDLVAAIALLYLWLAYPERTVPRFGVSLLLLLATVAAASFFFSYAFSRGSWRDALRRLPRAVAVLLVVCFLVGVVLQHVRQPSISWGLIALTLLASLPFFYAASGAGALARALRSAHLWAAGIAWLAAAVAVPYLLIRWVPQFDSLPLQTLSLVVRFSAALACTVYSTLTLAHYLLRYGDSQH
jgi:uncharacterized membrane protein (DUF441 family)